MSDLLLNKELLSFPGETIQEHIDKIGMSQAELAERMGRTKEKINELIQGKAPLTTDTAQKLEFVLGVPAGFWLNLEAIYRSEILEIEKLESLEESVEWLKDFPIAFLKNINFLPNTKEKPELVEALLKFFRIGSPKEWEKIYQDTLLAFKIALKYITNAKPVSVWLRLGEVQAGEIQLMEFDKRKITKSLPVLQKICYHYDENWLEQLQLTCAAFGVALVYTPCIPKAPIYGAARWIKNKTVPLIQITDRHKDYHSFWFSFYHELGHIRFHNKSDIFLSGITNIKQIEEKEKEADDFATKMLITPKAWNRINQYPFYRPDIILSLSKELMIHPSILISRLQREKLISYNDVELNALKTKVEFQKFTAIRQYQ